MARKLNVKFCPSTLNVETPNNDSESSLNDRVHQSIFLSPTSPSEMVEIFKSLENNKFSDISNIVLKKCFHYISGHFSGFCNKFIEIGKFPDVLKVGKITPIYKKGDPQLLDNYRPVSVIPIFGKIFEKVIYNRLYSFFSAMNVIYDKQFGFRKNHSTKHAVNYSVNHLFEI